MDVPSAGRKMRLAQRWSMIINVRGTNGAGKTTLMRQVMAKYDTTKSVNAAHKVDGYRLRLPGCALPFATVIGSYENVCGGCDGIKTQQEAKDRVREAANHGHVLFEGVLISTIFGPWLEFSQQNGGMVWAFLDTPLEVCLERIQIRNGGKPIKTEQVQAKWDSMHKIASKATAAGERVVMLPWQDPLPTLLSLLPKL